jgi:hypothetical protein
MQEPACGMKGQLFELGRWEIGNGKGMEDRK